MIRFWAVLIGLCCAGVAWSSPLAIRSGLTEVRFDASGRLTGIVRCDTGVSCYSGIPAVPFRLYRHRDGQAVEEPVRPMRAVRHGAAVSISYAGDGVATHLTVSPVHPEGQLRWSMSIRNTGSDDIINPELPCLSGVQIGGRPQDNILVRPNRYGQRIPDPLSNLKRPAGGMVDGLHYGPHLAPPTLIYPGSASMMWMDLYTPRHGGLYVSGEEPHLVGGFLTARSTDRLTLAVGRHMRIRPGEQAVISARVGVHRGDWRDGASWYRQWALSWMRHGRPPRWVREMSSWHWRALLWSMGETQPTMKPQMYWTDISGFMWDGALALRTPCIGLAGQELFGHDYPMWWPDPALGTEQQMRDVVQTVGRRGGRVAPYLNPIYAWESYPHVPHADEPQFQNRLQQIPADVLQPDWSRYQQAAARGLNGTLSYVEWHYYGRFPQMCLQVKDWQDHIIWWTRKYVKDYGFAGAQWDQLGAYPSAPCSDPSHGHRHDGTGVQGMLDLCARALDGPDPAAGKQGYLWYEGACDFLHRYLSFGHSGGDSWMAWGMPELFQYTFPLQFGTVDPCAADGSGPEALARRFRRLEWMYIRRMKTGVAADLARKMVRITPVTNALKTLYWYGAFHGSDGLRVPAGVEARLLVVSPDESPSLRSPALVIPMMDLRAQKTNFTVQVSGQWLPRRTPLEAWWYPAFNGGLRQRLAVHRSVGGLTVDLPGMGALNAFDRSQACCPDDGTTAALGALVIAGQPLSPLRIEAPMRCSKRQSVTIRVWKQTGSGAPQSWRTLDIAAGRSEGIRQVPVVDGRIHQVQIAGRRAQRLAPDTQSSAWYGYYRITDPALRGRERTLEMEVTWLDSGSRTLTVQYNSSDPAAVPFEFAKLTPEYRPGASILTGNSGVWKTARFQLPQALLTGGMNGGADIRLMASGGDVYVSRIRMRAVSERWKPVEGAAVTLGRLTGKTDRSGRVRFRFDASEPTGGWLVEARRDGPYGLLPDTRVIMVAE